MTAVNDKTFESSKEMVTTSTLKLLETRLRLPTRKTEKSRLLKKNQLLWKMGKTVLESDLIDRTEVSSDVPIKFSTAGIGGPSAGMMFSLSIYTQIADPTLRNGRIIAGTGSIDRDGNVGDIGGIDKKVVAAAKKGATVFFAPNNPVTEEAKKDQS